MNVTVHLLVINIFILWNQAAITVKSEFPQVCCVFDHVLMKPTWPCPNLYFLPRFWVLRGKCQRQHQCEADLRAPGWHHLWKDVGEPGRRRPCRHRGQTGAPADRAARPSSPGLCMLKLTTPPNIFLLIPPLFPSAGPQGLGSILHHHFRLLSCFFL